MMKHKISSSHKISRNSRGSPVRKDHMMKKPMHSSISMRNSSTSRPLMKRLSPGGMKRTPILPPSKSVHQSRPRNIISPPHRSPPPHRSVTTRHSMQQSPVSIDRGLKRVKYDKRKMSPSPNRHPMPSSSGTMRGPSPYRNERYLNVRPVAPPPHYVSPPPKKKNRRDTDKFDHGGPMPRRPEIPPHSSERRMVQRSEMPSSRPMASMGHPGPHRGHMTSSVHNERPAHFDNGGRGRDGPSSVSNHSKRPPPQPIKPPYNPRNERYQSPPPHADQYSDGEKQPYVAPTLHERFSSVVESTRSEPRVKYSREDLEKITIDIHRHLKAESPTVRRIVNPNEVKLVRRANEGHRPMFDREEIKQAPRDMRDEAHWEKSVVKSSYTGNSGHSSRGGGGGENYEITRNRFEPHHHTFHSTGGRSLSDRWQNADVRKEGAPLDRDHRQSEYERQPMKRSFSNSRTSKAGDRDFRPERFSGPSSSSHGRPEYSPTRHMHSPPPEQRNSSSIHRKPITAPIDARRKLIVRRGSDRGPPPHSIRSEPKPRFAPLDKRYLDGMPARIEKPIDRRSPIMEPPVWKTKSRSDSREKISSFSRKPDKFSYNSEKSDGPSKSSNYYEDNRDSSDSYRGRGSSRPFRSPRGFRSRGGIRGSSRGSFPSRSTFRGSYRGRGTPRRGRISPGVWEHDMYPRTDDKRIDYP